jgi:hypothetical protein
MRRLPEKTISVFIKAVIIMTSNQEDKIISEFLESIGPWRDIVY